MTINNTYFVFKILVLWFTSCASPDLTLTLRTGRVNVNVPTSPKRGALQANKCSLHTLGIFLADFNCGQNDYCKDNVALKVSPIWCLHEVCYLKCVPYPSDKSAGPPETTQGGGFRQSMHIKLHFLFPENVIWCPWQLERKWCAFW